MFNWIFLKKLLFASSIISLSATPIFLINKYSNAGSNQYYSDLKRNFSLISAKYADKFGFKEFSKEIMQIEDVKPIIEEVFAKDIALQYLRGAISKKHKELLKKYIGEENQSFLQNLEINKNITAVKGKDPEIQLLDDNGGTRADMKRRLIGDKAYEFFKEAVTNFSKHNFTLNKSGDSENDSYFIRPSHYVSQQDLKTEKSKIGFYPLIDEDIKSDINLKDFYVEKFKFINFMHKQWFKEKLPAYVWMSLWKYDENATEDDLSSFYNKDTLAGDFPTKANYEFPLFSTKDAHGISSFTKFKQFNKNIVNKTGDSNSIYVSKGYTDDRSSSIYVEADNMYEKLYIKFAAAVNYKYAKAMKNGGGSNGLVNEKDKSSLNSLSSIQELFLEDSNTNKNAMKIDKTILKQEKQYALDAVEVKNTPWIFIRNSAGVHAIAVDGTQENDSSESETTQKWEKMYQQFNYRTLELIKKQQLKINETLDLGSDEAINSFKEYISKNFNRLLVKYALEKKNDKTPFSKYLDSSISSFNEVFNDLEKLDALKKRYLKRLKLRESLLKEYAKSEWEKTDALKKFKNSPKKFGLSASLPYKINEYTDKNATEKKEYIFEQLETLYDNFGTNSNGTKTLLEEFKETKTQLDSKLDNYLESLNLTLNTKISNFFQSDRIFTNNFFINAIVDKFLEKEHLLNHMLFKYDLKTNYLGKSILGKGYVEVEKTEGEKKQEGNLLFKTPSNSSTTTSNESDWFDSIDSDSDESKKKKVMDDIEKMANKFYYSRKYLEEIDQNVWDILKYKNIFPEDKASLMAGIFEVLTKIVKDDKNIKNEPREKMEKTVLDAAKTVFEEKYFLNVNESQIEHHKFLTTLSYLTSNNFENFRNLIASATRKQDAYLIWEKKDKEKTQQTVNWLLNPWIHNQSIDSHTNFPKEIPGFKEYLMMHFSPYGNKDTSPESYLYKGLFMPNNQSSWASAKSIDAKDFKENKTLYKYGKDAATLKKYVQSIDNEQELDELIAHIKEVSKEDWNNKLKNLELKTIYIKNSGSDTSKSYRSLTLTERKNLLSAYLSKKDVSITDDSIDKGKYKDIFLLDPDNNYNPTSSNHTEGNTEVFKGDFFKQTKGNLGNYHVIQISAASLQSWDDFKTFINGNINKETFWAWIMSTAYQHHVQNLAIKNLENQFDKFTFFDSKFKETAKSKFSK